MLVQTIGSLSSDGIAVDDIPLLVSSSVLRPDDNVLSFGVLATVNIKALVVSEVDNSISLILEALPPVVRVGSCDRKPVLASVSIDVPSLGWNLSGSYSLGLLVEPPFLVGHTVSYLNLELILCNS